MVNVGGIEGRAGGGLGQRFHGLGHGLEGLGDGTSSGRGAEIAGVKGTVEGSGGGSGLSLRDGGETLS